MAMADFDPYYQWLAIPPKDQPPDHYRLLGVELFESNADVISHAADKQMVHLCSFQTGRHADLSQKLLNEIAAAKICLLNPEKKAAYDRNLRLLIAPQVPPRAPATVSPPTENNLAFLEASTIVPSAISKAKPKRSLHKNRTWLAVGLFVAASLALATVLFIKLGQDGKDVASTESRPLPATAAPTEKDPASSQAPDHPAEPAKRAGPRASLPDGPLKGSVGSKPVDSGKRRDTNPQKPAEPASSPAGVLRPRPENNPAGAADETEEPPPKEFFPAEEKPKSNEPEVRPNEKSGATESAAQPNEKSQNPDKLTAQPKKNLAIPDEATQKQAVAIIRETYKDDYRQSDKAALAKKLRDKADEAKGDATARFALLQEAKKVAAEAGQGELSFEIIDVLAGEYQVLAAEMKAQVIEQAVSAKKVRSAQQQKAVAIAALRVMDDAIAEDDFDVGKRMGKQALQMARLTKDRELLQIVATKISHMDALAKAYADVQEAMETLKEKPNDPDANLAVGKYLCCKGQWERALPMLALGSDAALKALAKSDIEGADTPDEQVKLADSWWNVGQGAKGEWRAAILLHAGTWYQQAQPNLATALVKGLVEKRLEMIGSLGRDTPKVSSKPPPPAIAPFNEKIAKQHQTRWAKYLGKPVVQTNSIGMKLVLVPPGEFAMGSPQELIQEELRLHGGKGGQQGILPADSPQHWVRMANPFWLGATDVTQEEYQRVMGSNPSKFQGDPRRPVEQVSWYDAVEFCRRLSEMRGEIAAKQRYELPTEAQWEYACRAGNLGPRYFSAQPNPLPLAVEEKLLGEYAWIGDAGGQTRPVGQKRANAWGLYDMYGNVWEWCQDWYDKDYYAKSTTDDPIGPPGGLARVRRGGSWNAPANFCRSAYREGIAPRERFSGLGFRVSQVPVSK